MKKIIKILSVAMLFSLMFSISAFAKVPYEELGLKCAYKYIDSTGNEFAFYHGGTDGTETYTVYFEDTKTFWICCPANVTIYGERYTDNQINGDYYASTYSLKAISSYDDYDWGYDIFYSTGHYYASSDEYYDWNMDLVYPTQSAFFQELCNYSSLDDFLKKQFASEDENKLPSLKYDISMSLKPTLTNFLNKMTTVRWDYKSEQLYSDNANDYIVQAKVSDMSGENTYWITQSINVNVNCFKFSDNDIQEKLKSLTDYVLSDTVPYKLYVRTKDRNTDDCSYWCVFVWNGVAWTEGNSYVDDDGNAVEDENLPSSDIDNATQEDDPTVPSANDDPTSSFYTENTSVSAGNWISSLKTIVKSLNEVPLLLNAVMGWLPTEFATLVVASMAILVIVGLVKALT